MLLEGMSAWLAQEPDIQLIGRSATVEPVVQRHPIADVVLLDLRLQDDSDPADNVARLVGAGYRVLVVSTHRDGEGIVATFRAGSHGYVTKDHDLPALTEAIRLVASGETVYSPDLAFALFRDNQPERPPLSDQERAIVVAYASGMTLTAAARSLGIRPGTAKEYLDRVKAKYRAAGRPAQTKLELADRVREDGL